MWSHGGIYLDVEDHLLVPFETLLRPCDSLLLVRDLCPEKDDRLARVPCKMPAVQISMMAAVPRHPFFRCALAMAVRNIQFAVHGRNTLDTTGPVCAGACLRKLHSHINYSMTLFMAHERSRASRWNRVPVAIYDTDMRPVVRAHAWAREERKSMRLNAEHVNYITAWEHGKSSIYHRNCSARREKVVAEHNSSRTRKVSGREAFEQLWRAIQDDD